MYKNIKITIIGLGLIGGSLAKALHERAGITCIYAVDHDEETLRNAKNDGIIMHGSTTVDRYVHDSDIIFICTPVKFTKDLLVLLNGTVNQECIITDVGSIKGEIINFADSLLGLNNFIGGHPMAGSEKAGYEASYSHLFENAYYILCPGKKTLERSIKFLSDLLKVIGAIPVILDAREHDSIVASISHVPHIIASALVNLVRETDTSEGKARMLAAGGFRDITRIASSNPEMWEGVILGNATETKRILNYYIKILNNIKESIEKRDSKAILNFFESARKYRDSLPDNKKGLIEPNFEIVIDVVDKPGIIGEITSILGHNNINIKNINVSNSREFEQGCLRISFPDNTSKENAFNLLTGIGYRVFKNS
ncbi:MAG TPA: prephenate dehydrogenase [Clostridiaceae bacterium]|nr:prephenate dehydrogenase [Clostridiaceae bacterium]